MDFDETMHFIDFITTEVPNQEIRLMDKGKNTLYIQGPNMVA